LSEKQLEDWEYIQKHKKVTPRELQKKLKMPTPTILQILNKLLNMKKIERAGEGRAVRYELRKIAQ
jgi:predicted HTH transcriptional regulator